MGHSEKLLAPPCTLEIQFVRHRRSVFAEPVVAVQVRRGDSGGGMRRPRKISIGGQTSDCCVQK